MTRVSCIYKITSKKTKSFYIGSAVEFINRKRGHSSFLKRGIHPNKKLQNHVNKYGFEDLVFSIIETVLFAELLLEREQYYINTLNPAFNLCKIAGSQFGRKHSNETKKKISIAMKKRKLSDEHKRKIGIATRRGCTGMKLSIESIRKRSAKQTGLKRSPEFCKNFSERQMKPVINIVTGIKHQSMGDAAKSIDISLSHLSNMLNNKIFNTTKFRFAYSPIDFFTQNNSQLSLANHL